MQNLEAIDWKTVKSHLKNFATSEMGKISLSELKPLGSIHEAQSSFDRISEVIAVIQSGRRPYMESLDLYTLWAKRLEKEAVLKTIEFRDIKHFCVEAIALKEILGAHGTPWISSQCDAIMNAEEPLSAIEQIITNDGQIRPDASEKLYNLTKEKDSLTRQLEKSLDRIVKNNQLETVLQDRYVTTREGRWVIPVKSGMQHEFKGIIHGASHSKQTVFMEPEEVVPVNNRLRQIEHDIEEEIERLLTQLSLYLANQLEDFIQTKEIMHECDVLLSQAALAVKLDATIPEFSENKISLKKLRHPVLVLNNERVIPNTVDLDEHNKILLLSGPNAGGKTVLLKALGLASQMARCGMPVCADENSQVPFFKDIIVAVGDSQSVDENLSTFAAHLKTLNQAAAAKGLDQLILIDEICGSTDPEEGSALARSFIQTYSDNSVFGIITSHLGALKMGWEQDSGVVNGSLEFSTDAGPTYNFFLGIPGQSLAIQTAKRVGVDNTIIQRAFDNLSPEAKHHQKTLDEAEKIKSELNRIRKRLEDEKKEVHKLKLDLKKKIEDFEKEKEQQLQSSLEAAETKVDEMIQHAKIDDIFKKHQNLNKIKHELPAIVKPSKSSTQVNSPEEFAKRFPPGSKVFSTSLNADAIVQGKPNNKGEVPVLSRSMRVVVPWQSLKVATQLHNPTQRVMKKTTSYTYTSTEQDPVVDVRGKTGDQAIEELELHLDKAALSGHERLKIVHGHGTDTLKRAVRSYLSRSVYVKKWQAGTQHNGGDGVTWVEIKD